MKKVTLALIISGFILSGNGYFDKVTFGQELLKVKAKKREKISDTKSKYSDWKEFDTRTVNTLKGFSPLSEPKYGKYGGRLDMKDEARGFFYSKKINGRWWLVDPEGYLFIHKGIVGVKPGTSKNQEKLMLQKFKSAENWLAETSKMFQHYSLNGSGNWSEPELLKDSPADLIYTRGFNFMAAYGKKRGGTFMQPGHVGYPNDLIFVFDSAFAVFCDAEAAKAASFKDEKKLLGYFSDNEMPFPEDALDRYLKLGKNDPGYIAASQWISKRYTGKTLKITKNDRDDFLQFMAEKYFYVVSSALKKYDPNHLYLGCRFYGKYLKQKPIFTAAGKFLDVISINYYDVWTPKNVNLQNWESWSQKPVLITEWYTKAEDSGMGNESGAGWIVPTQRDRGYFYQNYCIALLESKVCVGWHWFKYQDNDPEDEKSDPSNKDSNKGIVNSKFEPYNPLLEEMGKLNSCVYSLIDYLDKK